MLITVKMGGVWESEGKVEGWEFVKSCNFIRYFILRLKHCHMIMTWHQSSHIIVNNHNNNNDALLLPPSSPHHHHHPMNGNNNDRCNNPNTQQPHQ
jgi:hypothetical protein